LVIALAVTIAGCSGESGPVEAASTTSSGTTTTTGQATTVPRSTTTVAATTTTEPSLAEDPVALLAAVNAEMAEGHSFLMELTGHLKDSATARTDLATAKMDGGHAGHGNTWLSGNWTASNPSRAGVIEVERREVGGVTYGRTPATGLWEVSTSDDVDPAEAAVVGELELGAVSAEETPATYVLRGTFPGDPTIQQVEVVVLKDSLVISQVNVTQLTPRSDLAGLVPPGGGDVFNSWQLTMREHGADVAQAIAPPESLSTNRWSSKEYPFQLQVPKAWEPAPASELENLGASAAFAKDDLLLLIVEEDLVEAGVGETTLENYSQFIQDSLDDDMTIKGFDEATTLQGKPSVLVGAADRADFTHAQQLIYLHDGAVGFRASFVGPKVRLQEAKSLTDFVFNSFLVAGAS